MPNLRAISGPPRSPNNSDRSAANRSARASFARTDSGRVFRRAICEFLHANLDQVPDSVVESGSAHSHEQLELFKAFYWRNQCDCRQSCQSSTKNAKERQPEN